MITGMKKRKTSKSTDNQSETTVLRTVKRVDPVPPPERVQLRYKKVTGGIFITSEGTQIKRDTIFLAYPDEISAAFISDFVCLDAVAAPSPGVKVGLTPATGNKWNVINTLTGDILNDIPLDATAAKLFLEEGASLPAVKSDPIIRDTAEKIESLQTKEVPEEEYDD